VRFDKETRALIHQAAPDPTVIRWPAGEPQKGRLYWVQAERTPEEEQERAAAKLDREPETCGEVMAGMIRRRSDREPKETPRSKHRRREPTERPKEGDPRLMVIDVEVLEEGFAAKVVLYANPDPVHHLRVPAVVPAGPDPLTGMFETTETEPEQMLEPFSLRRRAEQEDALKLEHKASVDSAEIVRAEKHLRLLREQGKPTILAEQAAARARKRAENPSASTATYAA
jgi:hypothetical protein